MVPSFNRIYSNFDAFDPLIKLSVISFKILDTISGLYLTF